VCWTAAREAAEAVTLPQVTRRPGPVFPRPADPAEGFAFAGAGLAGSGLLNALAKKPAFENNPNTSAIIAAFQGHTTQL